MDGRYVCEFGEMFPLLYQYFNSVLTVFNRR